MKKILFLSFSVISISVFAQGVGINKEDPKSSLDVNGNVSFKVVFLNGGPSGSATQISDGFYINLNPALGNVEFIVPDATSCPGRTYIMRNISGSETAVIYSFGGNFFASNSTNSTTSVNLPSTGSTKTMFFYSDGVNWTYGSYGF